jgi:restriction endonuclease S subunit
LDELEAVELRVSEVLEDNEKFRFDPEYFKKEYIVKLNKIKLFGYTLVNDNAYVTDGIHESIDFDSESIINLISAKSPKENIFDLSSNDYISEKQNKDNPRTKLQENDVIISTVGTIGNCAVVDSSILPANSDRHVGIIRLNTDFKPYVLSTFLLSKYGRFQTLRESTGNVQLNLFIYKIKTLKIPNFSNKLQLKIETFVKSARKKVKKSKSLYEEAENILLKELDLLDFEPTQENIVIKSFSESFLATGRLDSEYYQPKYDEVIEKIKNYRGGFEVIESACNLKDSNHKPTNDKHYQYIELSNIGTTGDITGFTYNLGKKLPSRARRLVKENDVIISSIEGSLGKVALVTKVFNNSLCSTGFYVLNSDKINSETLLVLFKNRMIQQILKQNCSGTILTGMNKDEFLNIVVPIIDLKIQIQISEKIKTSFQLKSESIELLALAKRAVEMAIEEGEEKALEMIR